MHRYRDVEYRTIFFFFFQAEDGIRDGTVTGVQTCALPILELGDRARPRPGHRHWPEPLGRLTAGHALGVHALAHQIGRASCRERVEISVGCVSNKKKNLNTMEAKKIGMNTLVEECRRW